MTFFFHFALEMPLGELLSSHEQKDQSSGDNFWKFSASHFIHGQKENIENFELCECAGKRLTESAKLHFSLVIFLKVFGT